MSDHTRPAQSTDVVVVGGGTGGVTAALAAAELGARVTVVDRDSGLGGVGTRGGIHFYYWGHRGGLQDGLDKQVRATAVEPWGPTRGFHPVAKQVTVETRLAELGVDVVPHAVVSDVIMIDGRIGAVEIDTPEGRHRLACQVVVDATGNGDVAALAGARYTVGRAWDQVMNPCSFVPRFDDGSGQLTFANFDCGWLDSTDPDDLGRALARGRETGLRRIRRRGDQTLLSLGPQLGIREGRRILGRVTVRQHEILDGEERADIVFRCRTHHDTHARDYANESDLAQLWVPVLGWRKRGFRGDIPYGALVPADVDGLLIGCRAFSGDQDIAAGVRMQRDMHRLGEAAGVAAALAVRLAVVPRDVPVAQVQQHLRSRGVLDELGTSTVPDGPGSAEQALSMLGQDDESEAWWWFRNHPEEAHEELVEPLSDRDPRRRRGAAFALAIRGDAAGLPVLRQVVRDGDDDAPGDPRIDLAAPRWLAALILLRLARDPGVVDTVVGRLAEGTDSATMLYLLHYLRDLAPALEARERAAAIAAVDRALEQPGLGEDFVLQGSDHSDPLVVAQSSVRWNIELTASATLDALGADGAGLRERWRHDERGAARRFVRHLETPAVTDGLETQSPLPDRAADVVVAGGGAAGVAAALELAAAGQRVTLVEPGPVLGWEVTAARRTSLGHQPLADPLLLELERRGCIAHGHVDAVGAAVALDRICADAGIEVLLLAAPGDALLGDGGVVGLDVTTIAGQLRLRAGAVIDATPQGRLLGRWARRISRDPLTGLSLIVRSARLDRAISWEPRGSAHGSVVSVEPLAEEGWARFTVLTPVSSLPAHGLLSLATSAFEQAVSEVPELAGATLALPADEALEPIGGRRRLHETSAVPAGLVAAGPFMPDAPDVTVHDRAVLEHALAQGRRAASGLLPAAVVG